MSSRMARNYLKAFADTTAKALLVELLQVYEQITANMKAADAIDTSAAFIF